MDEKIQYFIVNSELNMSSGKVAAQVAHVAVMIALQDHQKRDFIDWFYNHEMKKIVLKGKEKDLRKLIGEGFTYVLDNGHTEISPGSLTVVGLPPMSKSEAQGYIKRLRLY